MGSLKYGYVTVSHVPEWAGHLLTRDQLVPGSDRASWEANASWLIPSYWDPESEDAWMVSQTFVLQTGQLTIVLDAGVGNDKSRPFLPQWDHLQSDYLERLSAVVDPAEVDLVINTHLHPDHVGWNTRLVDGAWVPTFPNATYLLPAADANRGGQPEEGSPEALVIGDSIAPLFQSGLVQLVDGVHVIDENLTLQPAPGHSPGHLILKLSSGGEDVIFGGDVLHTPMEILQPQFSASFDEDQAQSQRSRQEVLGLAADSGAPLFLAHIPGGRGVRIARDGDAFAIVEWIDFN